MTRMFRPKSLSPNTMYPQANGLDFFLLPELFMDCLPGEGHLALLSERDAWFAANPKYGPAYLDRMAMIKAAGVELVPDLAGHTERYEPLREPFSDLGGPVSQGATKRGRRFDAIEQLSRAGGLPRMSVSDLSSVLLSFDQNGSFSKLSDMLGKGGVRVLAGPPSKLSPLGQSDSTNIAAGGGQIQSRRPVVIQVGGTRVHEDEDYDTEEESDVQRKRRKHSAAKGKAKAAIQVKAESGGVSIIPAADLAPPSPAATAGRQSRALSSLLRDDQPEVKIEATSSITPSTSSMSSASSQPRLAAMTRHRPVARFSIDKEHLRAYARVAAEVDDL